MKRYLLPLVVSIVFPLISFATSIPRSDKALDEIIAQARARLAPEDTLDAVETLIFDGKVVNANSGETNRLTLYLKKPYKQRMEMTQGNTKQILSVDGNEGYLQILDTKTARSAPASPLPPAQVQQLMANALENLFFFKGTDQRTSANAQLLGREIRHGKETYAVLFDYDDSGQYTRFFDINDGKLVSTVDRDGLEMVEEDETQVNGIRFPKRTRIYNPQGQLLRTFESKTIQVNTNIPDSVFAFPALASRSKAPATAPKTKS